MKNEDVLVFIIIAVLIIFLFSGFFGFGGMGSYGMMGYGMRVGFGFIFMLLFWGLIIWFIVTLVNSSQSNKKEDLDSLTILRRRYAKGEITRKEFDSIKKELV